MEKYKKDKISVIIPNYNNASTLKRCIDSVLEQTYQNFEIIIVDDGSTDNSIEVLRDYQQKDKRFMLVFKPNGGVSSARNAGHKLATGEYIQFIDADDHIEKHMFETVINAFKATKADMVTFRFTHDCWKAFLPAGIYHLNDPVEGFKLYSDFFTFELPWNKMIRSEALTVPHDENIKIFEGSLFYLANHKGIKKVAVLEDELHHYYNAGAADQASCVNGFLKSKFWENKSGYWYKLYELWPLFEKLVDDIYGGITAKVLMLIRTFDMAFIELVKLIDSHCPAEIIAKEMHNIFNEPAFKKSVTVYGHEVKHADLKSCENFVNECVICFHGVKDGKINTELYYKYISLFFNIICGGKVDDLDFVSLDKKIKLR